ncbi:MAG: hypothetical protein ACOCQ2_00430 [Halanaerobiales bacterium]
MNPLSDTARLFLNSLLNQNMTLVYFLGILFIMVEAKSIKKTSIKGLKYIVIILIVNILGWYFASVIFPGYVALRPAIFFITTILGITILLKWDELQGEWLGLPYYILFIGPLYGSQWLISSAGHDYSQMITVSSGYIIGFYILFVLSASMKEQILVSDATPLFKRYSTLLAALGMLALGIIGFHLF